jgi:hypothetical protein
VKQANALYSQRNYAQALALYQKAAAQGNAEAEERIGELYWYGLGVSHDNAQATAWFQKAAALGNALAEFQLGLMNAQARNYAEALAWYQKSAAQGEGGAEVNLGLMYQRGLGVAIDYAQALALYRKAAAQGMAEGQIGWMYQQGLGVATNFPQALIWYRKAAAKKDLNAESNLGYMYQHGQGVPVDYAQALAWYRKAAPYTVLADENLGLMYRYGLGTPIDYGQAISWYQQAAARGDQNAVQALAQMNSAAQPEPAQPAPAPQQTASSDSSQPAADYQHCAIVTEKTVNLNGMNDNTLVQLGNSCNFAIDTVAVSTSHRVLNGRAANDPGGGIGWSSTANGDPFIYVCPDPLEPVDENGNLPTAPNQTIYCKQVTLTGRQEY